MCTRKVDSVGLAGCASTLGLINKNQQGTDQASALNQDNLINDPSTQRLLTGIGEREPAAGGTVIQLFGTGGGATNPDVPSGGTIFSAAPTLLTPTALIDGIPATVQYSGGSPGLVGVWQVNLVI